jgi:hypothetical protein
MEKHVCDHLRKVEDHLRGLGRAVTASGKVWSNHCRFWVYFDAVLDCEALRKRFELPAFVEIHENNDPRSGRERGVVCTTDEDAVMGIHPLDGRGAAPVG